MRVLLGHLWLLTQEGVHSALRGRSNDWCGISEETGLLASDNGVRHRRRFTIRCENAYNVVRASGACTECCEVERCVSESLPAPPRTRTWPDSCGEPRVECRIEVVRGVLGTVVRLAGRLGDAQAPDFVETCASAARPLRIDLSELVSVDAVGIEALLRVREMGATFDGPPEYLRLKIEARARERPGKS